MVCVQATYSSLTDRYVYLRIVTFSYGYLRIVTFSYGYLRKSASVVSPCEILKISKFRRLGAVILRFITDQLRTVTSTYDPADACVRAASTYPYLSAADVTQRKRLCDWGISWRGSSRLTRITVS